MKDKLLPIWLNEKTLPWIERQIREASGKDFIADMLKKDIESAKAIQAHIEACEHEKGEFVGKRISCKKCASFYEAGCFESWTNKS